MAEPLTPWEQSYLKAYVEPVSARAPEAFERHAQETHAFLAAIPESAGAKAYAPGKWTVSQVVEHMLASQLIFLYRAVCIAHGETQSLPGFDENAYAAVRPDGDLPPRLAEAYAAQSACVRIWISLLRPPDWERQGAANGIRLTPRVIFRALIGHERHHLEVLRDRYGLGAGA
jgi:hypothetical protein